MVYMRSIVSLALLGALSSFAVAQCTTTVTHSGANFSGGSFIAEAGMAEGEAGAATYTLPAGTFPIKLNLAEAIWATSQANVQTTTIWEVFGYQGTPANGTEVFSYVADDVVLPYLRLGPGTAGANVQFSVDPQDPEQIIIQDDGSHSFTIGYRIIQHNTSGYPPPTESNAFMTVDNNGLQQASRNWLYAVDVGLGPLQVPPGWHRFSDLSSFFRPSGDWNIRFTYESLNPVQITDDPDNVTINLGQPAAFSVVASGPNLQYQWYKGFTAVQNVSGRIFGAQTPDLVFLSTQAGDAGDYSCVVSTTCGSVTSDTATLAFNGANATMTGHITLNDFLGSTNSRPFVVRFFSPGTSTQVASIAGTLNASSNYSITVPGALLNGTYDLALDIQHWLRDKNASVPIGGSGASNVNFTVENGDVDDDGEVTLTDIDLVLAAYQTEDPWLDINGSGEVDLTDIDIVITHFGLGDE